MNQIAKVVRADGHVSVSLPDDFVVDATEMDISREGDAIVLRPRAPAAPPAEDTWPNLRKFIELGGFTDDFMPNGREQPEMQERPELDDLFK